MFPFQLCMCVYVCICKYACPDFEEFEEKDLMEEALDVPVPAVHMCVCVYVCMCMYACPEILDTFPQQVT
jgi:hypothetical protein